ncbi:MAG: hypothetical protein U1F17_12900 [Burkholderiaceae bacterium]
MGIRRSSGLRRLAGAFALGSAFVVTPASACLIEYSLAAESVPLTIDTILTIDTSLPIAQQVASFEVVMSKGTIDERRQDYAAMFEDFDQKANQLFAILLEVIRAEQEADLRIVRNIAGAASSLAEATADRYSLIFSLPDGSDLVLPLEYAGTCIGAARSPWAFVGEIPEPSTALLILAAVAASWPAKRHSRRVEPHAGRRTSKPNMTTTQTASSAGAQAQRMVARAD